MREYITIESDDKEGEIIYTKIILDVLSSVQTRLIEHLHVRINMKEGYFILSAQIKKKIKPIKLSELNIETIKEDVLITVDPLRERFLPTTLEVLESVFGKERISQPSRYKIIVKNANLNDLKDLIIFNYTNYAHSIITEILFWIAPELFKVTYIMKDEEKITIIFSEYDLKETWLEEMRKIHDSVYPLSINSHAFSESP